MQYAMSKKNSINRILKLAVSNFSDSLLVRYFLLS